MKLHAAWLFALVAASVPAQAPVPSTGSAFVLGRVVDGTSGRPLPDVTVTLSGPPRGPDAAPPQVRTSADGYFLFAGLARGKPESGTIRVGLHREGSEMVIVLEDDGRGIDVGAVRARARERGLLHPGRVLSDEEAL